MGSYYLFADPSFLSGAARNVDLMGVFDEYNDSFVPELADAIAVYSDWAAIGDDVTTVVAREEESPEPAGAPRG